eukprot:TRINITY_DN7992_c0_g1_i2.p1 TRINITY_DN7992_c0_g1~~TRINITY_DN7992_c0_g1_i2.p1  ORF type:complete len:379 (+),score=89.79 TRINITY_DN7992_c0_g1_i2:27-1139(+)
MADAEIAQFVEVTGATSEQAKQFLAQAGNDVNTAITLFLASQLPSDTAPPQAAPPSVPSAASSRSRPAPPRRTGGANIATFSSMNTADDDEDDDKPNEYYTGGHNSGLAVEGNPEEARKKLFERAQKEGQSYEDFMRERQASQQRFAGRGFTLGDDESASQAVGTSLQEAPKPKKPTAVKITFWKGNKFTVELGEEGEVPELRDATAPANQAFMQAISNGRVPAELASLGTDIHVELLQKDTEDYVPPKPQVKAFGGAGFRLGAPTPQTSAPPAATSIPAQGSVGLPKVDDSKPKKRIMVRLADGTRLKAMFNADNTVADVRQFVMASRPGEGARSFVLVTSHPATVITDESQTIEAAGLLGAVVTQKYT